jgi:hypothetical protein
MTLLELRLLRQRLDTLFYYSFENLTDDQRMAFRGEIEQIDLQIRAFEEF